MPTPKITPCLWFDNQAEEAAKFYTGIFKNSSIKSVTRYSTAGQETHRRSRSQNHPNLGKYPPLHHHVVAIQQVSKSSGNVDEQQGSQIGDGEAQRNTVASQEYYHCCESRHADHYSKKDHS